MVRRLIGIVAVCACGAAQAAPPALEAARGRTNFFAGRETTLGTVIRGGDAVAGRLAWTLTAFGRTLAGGAVDVRHDGGRGTAADVVVVLPEVKAGTVVEAIFTAVLVDAAGTRLDSHARPVRIFPADPFVDRTRWLEALDLALLDPVGDTARVLTVAGVPFELVGTEADIDRVAPRIVVAGEGTSWHDHPDLPGLLERVAARGVPVLCLAPRDGTLPLPGAADAAVGDGIERLALERAGIVAAFDPRLDGHDWVAAGRTIVSRVTIAAADGQPALQVVPAGDEPGGWPWLEITHAAGRTPPARLVVCGYGIVAHWDETPAARYLFAAILERLTAARAGDRHDSLPTDHLPEKSP